MEKFLNKGLGYSHLLIGRFQRVDRLNKYVMGKFLSKGLGYS